MKSTVQDLSLNCILSTQNDLKKTYIVVTLFHDRTSKYEKRKAEVDAQGNVKFRFKDVNVELACLCFQVYRRRWLVSDKHVGDVIVLVSDLESSQVLPGQPFFASYELGKASKKGTYRCLKLMCTLSSREINSAAVVSRDKKPKHETAMGGPNPMAIWAITQGLFV